MRSQPTVPTDRTSVVPPAAPAGYPPPPTPPSGLSSAEAALVAEACSRTGVVWVSPNPADRWYPAWHVWHENAVHLIRGPEQDLPELAGEVLLAVPSKDTGSRLVTAVAWAEVLPPDSPSWQTAATALSGARLNDPDPASQHSRWRERGQLLRLTPTRLQTSGPGDDTTPSGAATPAPTEATTGGRRPFHFGGRTRRWRRVRG